MNKIDKIENKFLKTDIPVFKSGDKLKVMIRISEENKDRLQAFEGIVIKTQGSSINKTFTIRKFSHHVCVKQFFYKTFFISYK